MTIAKLGETGKWHVVRMLEVKAGSVFTACRIKLEPIKSSLRTVEVEVKEGKPTCKHCLRLRMKEII
jgi:hypothetical protein